MEETIVDTISQENAHLHFSPQMSELCITEKITHPTTLSLFSGAGGLDIGFHKAGFKIIACIELESIFCQTLQNNVGTYLDIDCQVLQRDIRDFMPEDLMTGDVEFIIGGPPCQSFSAIGRRAGGAEGMMNDRGGLFEHYCRLVDYYRPKGF
ncbi:MAG TPA: DNA cytosine methyltransferase, partial [Ktedonobacteraceae bacterium]|nr:DNA cytosine methyltransferase [Ktedonobacteraceae bacterium]